MDIHKGFGNSNKLLGRFLFLGLENQIQLISIDGGSLRNAIPREAKAIISVNNSEDFTSKFEQLKSEILEEFASLEKDLVINIEKTDSSEKAVSIENSKKIIFAINAAHNGVFRMSPDVEGLVEASNNVARVELKNGEIKILNLTRSSVESTKWEVANQLESAFESNGLTTEFGGSYPGWKPKPEAEIIKVMTELYQNNFGEKPLVVACHAGLECGIIGANYPKMEMVSFGPTIKGAHSPDERASISSVQKFWTYTREILKNILINK
jgi:dipeptidase D